MRIENMLKKNKSAITAVILLLIVFVPIGYYLARDVFPQDAEVFLEMPDQYDECVEDTEYMRFRHMELLLEMREKAVREGIRGEHTLSDCRDCHTNRSRFCNQCHNIVNLNLDCFGCHNYPETPQESAMEHASKLDAGPGVHRIKAGH